MNDSVEEFLEYVDHYAGQDIPPMSYIIGDVVEWNEEKNVRMSLVQIKKIASEAIDELSRLDTQALKDL